MKKMGLLATLVLGFFLGWWSRPFFYPSLLQNDSQNLTSTKSPSKVWEIEYQRQFSDVLDSQPKVRVDASSLSEQQKNASVKNNELSLLVRFDQLIQNGDFDEAVEIYRLSRENASDEAAQIKSKLMVYLRDYINRSDSQVFNDLTQSYLSVFYDDISVLLLLAEQHKNAGYFFEALDVFQLSEEYALSPENNLEVTKAFDSFIQQVDTYLSGQSLGYLLTQIFQHAESVGLLNDKHRLRLSEIYIDNHEVYFARQILHELAEGGVYQSEAQQRLDALDGNDAEINSKSSETLTGFEGKIPLIAHGNSHYIAELNIGDGSVVRLLLDTGASMTTISRQSFDRLNLGRLSTYQNTRMFRTANGIARADINQVERLSFGDYQLKHGEIAVMDFQMAEGIDGLLGMNVLNHFIFQIDPSAPALLLNPR